ncbi:MAG: hypothetical protein AAGG68_10225 [Bacteroidota bacterium]
MIIANPIYDVVFKRLMENERVAKFFISTMFSEKVISLQVKPQEFTYDDRLAGLSVFRLDFIALIETETGEQKKILIEIQKAKNEIDLMRFRNYLAEQYKKQDLINEEKVTLPITTIYILGFKLPNIETACVKVERQYRDMINEAILEEKNDFIEKLPHDSYVVQARRITGRYQSRLDKLLSVFEQDHFVGDNEIIKEYKHITDEEEVELMTKILHHSGTDPDTREEIEKEQEAWRTVNAMFEEKEKTFKKALTQKNKELLEKDKALNEKDKALSEKENVLEEQHKLIEELKRKLEEQ